MRLSKQHQLDFAQQLLNLVNAGLALLNAIELIYSSSPKSEQTWLNTISILLRKGNSFSQSLIALDQLFSMEFINLIRISERTGDIELALNTICQQLEAQIELKQKVQQALSYPLITLGSSIALVVMMMLWVVPVFSDVFGHFQAELPPATKMLIEISSSIHAYFLEILIGLMTVISSLILVWIHSSALQRMADRWSFRLPLLGKLFRLATLTHWCRTLAHLLDCGLALPDALRLTAQSSNHWLSHDLTAEVFKHIARGWPLGDALKKADPKTLLFDRETLQLLHIAAESGYLAPMLSKRATALGSQLSNQLNTLSQTLEPLLIIIVGIVIGGLVIILYLPIFQMGQIV